MRGNKETCARVLFALAATISIASIVTISLFLFIPSFKTINTIGFKQFLLGQIWRPSNNEFGIFAMIISSFELTFLALLFAVPLGLFTSVFVAKYAKGKLKQLFSSAIALLSGIPSVVFGFFGIMVIVPLIRNLSSSKGPSMLAGSLVLSLMILPTLIAVTVPSLEAVDNSYYEGALALGANKEKAIFSLILPCGKSGVIAALVLAIGRAIGEATAVVMVAGNQPRLSSSVFDGVRTMSANVIMEMGYATELHQEALIATGAVLFIFILLINVAIYRLKADKRSTK